MASMYFCSAGVDCDCDTASVYSAVFLFPRSSREVARGNHAAAVRPRCGNGIHVGQPGGASFVCPRAVYRLTRVSQRIRLTSVVSFCSRAYVRQKPPKPDASLRPLFQCPFSFPPACLCGHVNRLFTVQYALGSLPHWVSRQLSSPSPSSAEENDEARVCSNRTAHQAPAARAPTKPGRVWLATRPSRVPGSISATRCSAEERRSIALSRIWLVKFHTEYT